MPLDPDPAAQRRRLRPGRGGTAAAQLQDCGARQQARHGRAL